MNARASDGTTALMAASLHGHTRLAEELLARGADPNLQGDQGVTPLTAAIIRGHFEIGSLLLGHNADPNIATDTGVTPLMAAVTCSPQLAERLIAAGAKVSAIDSQGTDALLAASLQGNARVIAILLQNGAEPFGKRGGGMTPIEAAEAAGHTEIAAILRRL
jgi:ankyrin repeat protein